MGLLDAIGGFVGWLFGVEQPARNHDHTRHFEHNRYSGAYHGDYENSYLPPNREGAPEHWHRPTYLQTTRPRVTSQSRNTSRQTSPSYRDQVVNTSSITLPLPRPQEQLYVADSQKPFSMNEMRLLMNKAEVFADGGEMRHTDWFYRNKHPGYFRNIQQSRNGMMNCIRKDGGGHSRSPINCHLSGLFFMANVDRRGNPPDKSPFGPKRLMVPVAFLMKGVNLYFADFYCMNDNKPHYVIIVVTVPGTKADNFCSQKLPRLDKDTNPFFQVTEMGPVVEVLFNMKLKIEIFYTKSININQILLDGGRFQSVVSTGSSTAGGIPNNPNCNICLHY